jgi:hypothetical protein
METRAIEAFSLHYRCIGPPLDHGFGSGFDPFAQLR